MRHLARTSALAAALLATAACKEKTAPPPAPQAQGAAAAPKPYAFTLRDLALATAVDARVAKLSLAGSEVEAALAARDAKERAKAQDLLRQVDAARAEADHAVQAVANALDRPGAERVATAAKEYADRLAAAASAPGAPLTPELAHAREGFGSALTAYRQSRAAWRFDAPDPQGAEREFAEARRDMERAETAFISHTQVAPRDAGHDLDPNALRMAGQMGVQRAKTAASRLSPTLAPHATRYANAQEQVLEAVNALQAAGEADRPRLARRYHAAKAEALAALADYFAGLSAR